MSESKAASVPGVGCTAVASAPAAAALAPDGTMTGVRPDEPADEAGGAGGDAGSSGSVGAVTSSVTAPATDGVSVAPSFGHTSTPAGYCVRHREQTDTPTSLAAATAGG
jgi:hypothetical protein